VQRVEASIGNSASARDRAEARHDRARLLPDPGREDKRRLNLPKEPGKLRAARHVDAEEGAVGL